MPPHLFTQPCEFLLSVVSLEQLPASDLPEVAFAGRSNVGKSSLLNALLGRKTLARTSSTPGRTRQLNFFNLADTVMLVDLPGYGYAKASKKDITGWTRLTRDYLRGRPQLRRIFLLIDSRHGLKENDRDIMHLLDECAVSYQIVLTKADKIKPPELEARTSQILAALKPHPAAHPVVLATSSVKRIGLEGLQEEISNISAT